MDIREKFAELSTPKKVLIVGGIGLVGIMAIRRALGGASSSSSTVSPEGYTQSLGNVGGSGSSGDVQTATNQQTQLDDLYNKIDILTEALTNTQTTTTEAIAQIQTTATTAQNESAFNTALMSTPSIYADSLDDSTQYRDVLSNLASGVSGGKITTDQAASAAKYLAGYGNNGVAQPGATYKTLAEIKADPKLLESELARTKAVIANRTEAGLDTNNGTAWLKMLTDPAA